MKIKNIIRLLLQLSSALSLFVFRRRSAPPPPVQLDLCL